MLNVDHDPQFTHTVAFKIPVDGGFETQTAQVTYRVVPTDRTLDLFADGGPRGEIAFLTEAVVAVADLVDGEGTEVPWNAALRDRLFGAPYMRTGFLRGYAKAMSEARAGN